MKKSLRTLLLLPATAAIGGLAPHWIAPGAMAAHHAAHAGTSALDTPLLGRRLGAIDRLRMGLFERQPGDTLPDSTYLGMPYQDTWISAIMRDEAGRTYWMLQTHDPLHADRFLPLGSNAEKRYMTFIPGLSPGPHRLTMAADGDGVSYREDGADRPFAMHFSAQEMNWSNGQAFSITGKRATPGIQLMLPWERGERAGTQLYSAEFYLASGTIAGTPVKGFVLFEHNYDEVPWSKGAFNGTRGALVAFSNEYANGDVESGYFYCGTTARAALVVDAAGRELTRADTMTVDAEIREGSLVGANYHLGDHSEWRYDRNPDAQVNFAALMGGGATPPKSLLSFGRVQRKGETRKLVRWWSSSESGVEPGQACSRK